MDFKQLEAFVAVVDWNSFSVAAKKLYLTQPTISAHIHSLEEELGTVLILRTTKNLSVTKEGYKLYDYAVNLIKLRKKAFDEFSFGAVNRLHIGASTIPSAYILPDILSGFKQKHPETIFEIAQSDSGGIIDKLLEGSVDIGIVGASSTPAMLDFKPFAKDRIVVCTPNDEHYRALKKQNVSIRELLSEPVILREQSSGTKKEADYLLEKLGITDVSLNIAAQMNDLEAIKRCIAKGMGVSLMSYLSVKDEVEKGDILMFEPEGLHSGRYFYIVTRKDMPLSPLSESFIHALQQSVKNDK